MLSDPSWNGATVIPLLSQPSLTDTERTCDRSPPVLSHVEQRQLSKLFDSHREHLLRKARNLTSNASSADDLIQRTLLRAIEHWSSVSRHPNPRAWLIRVMSNMFIDDCRRTQRISERTLESVPEPKSPTEDEGVAPWLDVTPEHLDAAIAQLPESLRAVVELQRIGFTYEDIARKTGQPKNTVGTRLMRARRKLKQILFERDDDEQRTTPGPRVRGR